MASSKVLSNQGAKGQVITDQSLSEATLPAPYDHKQNTASKGREAAKQKRFSNLAKHRTLSKNFFLKRLDVLYWKRLLRYVYVRFLRMRSSPKAIARGVAAGAFAGSFPLLGLQTLFGVAIASCVRGNKVVAAASTWISNPLTYVPLFALNFHIGRLLLRLPPTEMPDSAVGIDVWMSMGIGVGAALMLGSLIVGLVMSVLGYYVGFQVAARVKKRKRSEKSE
ncbi:MAG: DUF2062 domain-containing protein [Phormidesmis sp.]